MSRLVVVSPGSRSTPLVLALAAEPSVELVDVIDERAAAFFALGHARATGEAAIVVATSGTAPAHWYPAVLEAEASHLPLICLSADRPTSLSACGAPQTIDQHGLFGRHVRFFADLGDPSASPAWLHHVERTVSRALAESAFGPVHVNVRFDKPLEPAVPAGATELAARAVVRAIAGHGPSFRLPIARPSGDDLDRVARRIAEAEAPLVLAGPLPAFADVAPVRALAEHLGAPLAAEWGSQLRGPGTVRQLDLLLDAEVVPPVDLVVQVGAAPTASAFERWKQSAGRPLPRITIGQAVADPSGTAEQVVLGDVSAIVSALIPRLPTRPASRLSPALASLDAVAESTIEEVVHEGAFSEGAAVRAVFEAAPAGSRVLLGNSLPIRLAERFAPRAADVRVLVQRGVNGIDGLVAGALGSARTAPTIAILGDVTMLHDVGSLALAARLPVPLVVVVLDNGGGRIFEQLPIGRRSDLAAAMPHFTTEHGVDLCAVARAFGVAAFCHDDLASFRAGLAEAMQRRTVSVLSTRHPPHDARERSDRLFAKLAPRFR